jgi:hypothetical protein
MFKGWEDVGGCDELGEVHLVLDVDGLSRAERMFRILPSRLSLRCQRCFIEASMLLRRSF